MKADQALNALANRYGILGQFCDLSGEERPTNPETTRALLRAQGLVLDNDAMIFEALDTLGAKDAARKYPRELIIENGASVVLDLENGSDWQLRLEGSAELVAEGRGEKSLRRRPLPAGIHELTVQSDSGPNQITIIATPGVTPSIEDLTGQSRLWGLNAALYALRSDRNLGLGDFEDLACAAEAIGAQGAGYLGINPIHTLGWNDTETISPYSPSHRGFLNALHIASDRIPGLEVSPKARALIAVHQAEFANVRAADLINYNGFRKPFAQLLEQLFAIFLVEANEAARGDFFAFCDSRKRTLSNFATFESLSEDHGPDWRNWRRDLRAPNLSGVRAAGASKAGRMQFHSWLQWVAKSQLSDAQTRATHAGALLGLYLDLAVGPRRGGAETWCEGDSIAEGVSIGAPPDLLSPEGQNWNLAAYAPGKLSGNRYQAFRRVLRETMRHAGVLRIDHVLGMNRSFWIPDDGSPGGYVRQPFKSLLAVIAIEADRARTAVIGEDLGLVPEGFRKAIKARGLYGYSVLQYEKNKDDQFLSPEKLRPQTLACFGTHDTPTINGFQLGRDIDWWQQLDWMDNERSDVARRKRVAEVAGLRSLGGKVADDGKGTGLVNQLHTALAKSPVAMVSVQMDDLAGASEAQNLPGTIDEHPNWLRRSVVPVEEFKDWPALAKTGRMMMEFGRAPNLIPQEEKA